MLTELANSGDDFVKAFNVFLTYPFVDEVVGRDPQVARNLHMGDYANLSVELDLDVSGGVTGIPTDAADAAARATSTRPVVLDRLTRCLASGDLTSAPCQQLLGTVAGPRRAADGLPASRRTGRPSSAGSEPGARSARTCPAVRACPRRSRRCRCSATCSGSAGRRPYGDRPRPAAGPDARPAQPRLRPGPGPACSSRGW